MPGAGKTTEALATFACRAEPDDRLLVIAPKNAFAAWDEQIASCLPSIGASFVRLRKGDKIPGQLRDNPKLMIIGYQQLARVRRQSQSTSPFAACTFFSTRVIASKVLTISPQMLYLASRTSRSAS